MHKPFTISTLIFLLSLCLNGQDLETLLDQHFKAAAQEKMTGVESIVTSGVNDMSMAGIETSFVLYQSRPSNLRIEVNMEGNKVIQTYNGEKGWILAPGLGIPEPRELSADEVKALLEQATYENPLWNYEARNLQLELSDTDDQEKEYHLVMKDTENRVSHFYIDKESMLIIRYGTVKILGGSEKNIEVLYQDYRTVRGIPFAHREVTKMDGEVVNSIQFDKVDFNRRIDPDLFQKPSVN